MKQPQFYKAYHLKTIAIFYIIELYNTKNYFNIFFVNRKIQNFSMCKELFDKLNKWIIPVELIITFDCCQIELHIIWFSFYIKN